METNRLEFDNFYAHMQLEFQKRWYREYRLFLEECYSYCAGQNKSSILLDVGCYTGVFSLLYGKYFSRIELADVADLRASPVLGKYCFHQFSLDAPTLPIEIKEYDFINCLEAIEHVPDERQAITNLYSMLKPQGYLLLNVPNRKRVFETLKNSLGLHTKFPTRAKTDYANVHYREYSQQEALGLLKKSGFSIEKKKMVISGIGPVYFPSIKFFPDKYKKNIVILARKER